MKYAIRKPRLAKTFDPRKHHFESLEQLEAVLGFEVGESSETLIESELTEMYPDRLCMPVFVSIGSGKIVMLGVIERIDQYSDPEETELPFVAFVHPIAQTPRERDMVKIGKHWNIRVWKTPVVKVVEAMTASVELRATDLDFPTRTNAAIGKTRDGRPAIYIEVNGVEMSLVFDESITIGKKQAPEELHVEASHHFGEF